MDFNRFHGNADKGSIYLLAGLGENVACLSLPSIGLLRAVIDILILDGLSASAIAALGLSKRCEDLSSSSTAEAAFIASAAAGAGSSVAIVAMAAAARRKTGGNWADGFKAVLVKASSRGVPVLLPGDLGSLTVLRAICPFDYKDPFGPIPVSVEAARNGCPGEARALVLGIREDSLPLIGGTVTQALDEVLRCGIKSVAVLIEG